MKTNRKKIVIKVGGSTLTDSSLVDRLAQVLKKIRDEKLADLFFVHGGGPAINEELKAHQIEWKTVEGLRVTTPRMMGLIEGVLSGQVNGMLTRVFSRAGLPAFGITGTDAGLLSCKPISSELELVGRVVNVNVSILEMLVANGYIPVIAGIGSDRDGNAYNINADSAAEAVASALKADELIFFTDQDGVLDSEMKLIPELSVQGLNDLIASGVIKGGMQAKANAIISALKNGVKSVKVTNGKRESLGTVCRLDITP